jgi:hypothetical protein
VSPLVRRGELVLYLVVGVLAVGWMIGFDVSVGGPAHPPRLGGYLIGAAIIASPWLVAVRLTAARNVSRDAQAWLLGAAVAMLPADRGEWGVAMTAELAQVEDRAARWRFALGCAWAALFPPRGHGTPLTTLAAAGIAGVGACIAATGYVLVQYPIGALHFTPGSAIYLAAVLIGCLRLALVPPRALTTDRLAQRIGIGSAVALGGGLLLASELGLRQVPVFDAGIAPYVYLVPPAMIFVGSAAAAALGGSRSAGVQAAVWAAVFGSLVIFAVALLEAVRWYQLETSLILAADGIPLEAVGENLRNFTWGLILLPVWWLPFGIIGASVARAWHTTHAWLDGAVDD